MSPIRVLLFADSHLGFDLPLRPRVERRRRGHDFLANHEEALEPARRGEVDLVVHGGDVFHRSRVPPSLVYQAFLPLIKVAESGVPVFVVPGNHERSRIPHRHLAVHPKLHIFDTPATRTIEVRGTRVALSGFPYVRKNIRERFPDVLEQTCWRECEADVRLLCVHHCVEGATVGPGDYTFRHAKDVIRCADLPAEFAAVLSGHIHRHQVLDRDLSGRTLPTPVLYPGSVERTAFAELGEEKGFMVLGFRPNEMGGGLKRREFVRLPARAMVERELHPTGSSNPSWGPTDLEARLGSVLAEAPEDAVLRVRVHGRVSADGRRLIRASALRKISPPGMNLEVVLEEGRLPGASRSPFHRRRSSTQRDEIPAQLSMLP
jgi:DNA repair exonuclease SbcCD nuclease subunit